MGTNKRILLVFSDDDTAHLLERNILAPEGYQVAITRTCAEAERAVANIRPDLMILGDNLSDGDHIELAARVLGGQPTLPIILFTKTETDFLPREAMRLGLVDWLTPPINADDVREGVRRGLSRSQDWQDWLRRESDRYTGPLLQQVDELETLAKAGRAVTAKLDLDGVLASVVDAAVELTDADEGSILLLDEDTGELFMRAARNFQEEFVRTFRIPAENTLAGEVIKTGEPVFLDSPDPQKIKTSYLVHALIYVPLILKGKTVGVLGVDNRQSGKSFDKRHTTLISAMADYAAVAMENANLYSQTNVERNKLQQILTQIEDGVIVYDNEGDIILLNHTVRKAFALGEADLIGRNIVEIFPDKDVYDAIKGEAYDPSRIEIIAEDSRFYSVNVVEIPEIGAVATLHDITYLKELDNLKTDFVNTVSHDLRSPLTSILGYVELIERAGEVSEKQTEYIKRVQMSVHSITALIEDLLNLGRIEVGIEEDVERTPLSPIVSYAVDGLRKQIEDRKQKLILNMPEELPSINGNPIQLRQMMDNLISNAVKYTPMGGEITVSAEQENGQVIIRVADTGPGIPVEDQTRIFEKFYRAKNVEADIPGTGLGLAITKSIVDNHRGRIWVESEMGKGSVFTVVLPIAHEESEKEKEREKVN